MALRFRRRLRIAPGLALNFAKRGASVSLGGRGAHVTIGPRGRRTTIGLPGSGLSYSKTGATRPRAGTQSPARSVVATVVGLAVLALIGWLIF